MNPSMMKPKFSPMIKPRPHLMGITSQTVSKWIPTLGLWGAGVGCAVTLFASAIPRFQNDVLKNIPGVAGYYESKIPECDKPF
ncbi:ubiquinol-cytochrome-c reductase complex subunit-domain-containing protein [Melampsora americana]|nr:ubiquinol-cytochrome-c reductase complex subunit-domain-containing protein [Melampsora americana]KAH9817041.1 ubiquinol-cytochrome-c reductase complex subunit-domain-containing protein [Melampsora americana]